MSRGFLRSYREKVIHTRHRFFLDAMSGMPVTMLPSKRLRSKFFATRRTDSTRWMLSPRSGRSRRCLPCTESDPRRTRISSDKHRRIRVPETVFRKRSTPPLTVLARSDPACPKGDQHGEHTGGENVLPCLRRINRPSWVGKDQLQRPN